MKHLKNALAVAVLLILIPIAGRCPAQDYNADPYDSSQDDSSQESSQPDVTVEEVPAPTTYYDDDTDVNIIAPIPVSIPVPCSLSSPPLYL